MSVGQQESFAQTTTRTERIAALNDQLRTSGMGGQIVTTSGVQQLTGFDPATLLPALAAYADFDEDNDPYKEHDFGGFDYLGAELLWKIDYYDSELTFASPDPTDPSVTSRVLTVMLAEEY